MLEFNYTHYGAPSVLERLGSPIHYWFRGDPDGPEPVILLLHGAGVDHRLWAGQMDDFAAAHRVVTLDIRGHGLSRPAGSFSFPALIDDCFAVLDRVGVDKAIVIGLSMGGNIAQEMVFRDPRRVAALVCLDCTCNTLVPWIDRKTVPIYRALFPAMMALYPMQALLRQIGSSSALSEAGRRYITEASAQLSKRELTMVMTTLLAALHHEPGYQIPTPTLLLQGAEDRLGNIAKVMPRWGARDPMSQFVVAPDASHCANIDNPGFVNKTILDWLSAIRG